jgi:hypothetical protein
MILNAYNKAVNWDLGKPSSFLQKSRKKAANSPKPITAALCAKTLVSE